MPNQRQSRISTEQMSRSATSRPPEGYKAPGESPFAGLNENTDGLRYRLVRKYINGAEEDKTAFFRRAQRGWTPVKVEDLPQFSAFGDEDGHIQYDGCILCKIDSRISDADAKHWELRALGAASSAKTAFLDTANSQVKTLSQEGKERVFRGQLPTQ